jgi:dephospho-CoA kinase
LGGEVTRILLTGMSGVGKSAVAADLRVRGYDVIDTDHDAYRVSADGEWLWDEDVVDAFLSADSSVHRFVVGTASNQVGFYARFDQIVLLTAPTEVMVERIRARTDNPFGQTDGEMAKVLADKETFEPMLLRAADVVIATDRPLEVVVDAILDGIEA